MPALIFEPAYPILFIPQLSRSSAHEQRESQGIPKSGTETSLQLFGQGKQLDNTSEKILEVTIVSYFNAINLY